MQWNWKDQLLLRLLVFFSAIAVLFSGSIHASGHTNLGRRGLLTFKETPGGSNVTFDCSPSGPCVSCQYSEKVLYYVCVCRMMRSTDVVRLGIESLLNVLKLKKFQKIKMGSNLKLVDQTSRSAMEIPPHDANISVRLDDGPRSANNEGRILADDSSTVEGEPQSYITYRSCIPAVNEEKVSVLGFEGIVLCLLLISGSFVSYRRKQSVNAMPGAGGGRIQMTRF